VTAALGGHPDRRADEVLETVGLGDAGGRRVKGYSLGMRQRLAIAAALIGDPRVLILDEPANGLDPPGIRWLRELMRSQALAGRTVLVSSHVLAEVAQVVDDVVVIAKGSVRAAGPLAEVLGGGQEAATAVRSPDADKLATALQGAGWRVERSGPDQLLVHGASPEEVGRVAMEERIVLAGVSEQTRSLETAFFELTGEESGS
jgi:ABC-2 type transport system ATP-binding protein